MYEFQLSHPAGEAEHNICQGLSQGSITKCTFKFGFKDFCLRSSLIGKGSKFGDYGSPLSTTGKTPAESHTNAAAAPKDLFSAQQCAATHGKIDMS